MKPKYIDLQINDHYNRITKILTIKEVSEELYKLLFIPKLKYIAFKHFEMTLVVELKDEIFREKFNIWIEELYDKLESDNNINSIITTFNQEIRDLILFTSRETEVTLEKVRGLYGELLELKRLLTSNQMDYVKIIDGWHRPSPANHDFDYDDFSIEVKTIGRTTTKVKISSEYQLNSQNSKQLFLKVSKIDSIEKSNEDSLGKIYEDILLLFKNNPLQLIFQLKCAEDIFFSYLGPTKMPFLFKLWEIESTFYCVNNDFPKICFDNLHNGISNVKYEIDISSITSFKELNQPCLKN